jgi:eukaryotic-like serine/threonine-protein kinase
VRLALGDAKEAAELLERALGFYGRRQPDDWFAARIRLALAQAIWAGKGDRKRALSLAENARDMFARRGLADRAREAQAWINNLPGRRR